MRNFDWIFNEEGKVAEGKQCVYYNLGLWEYEAQVVTLAGYRPYYTDGTPDPKNDEVNEWCYIEINANTNIDPQASLDNLYEITFVKEREILYDGRTYPLVGTWEFCGETRYIIKDDQGDLIPVDDVDEIADVHDLSDDDYRKLYKECRRGSLYYSDYRNSVCVLLADAMDYFGEYFEWLEDEFGADCDEHDNVEEFLRFAHES